jgi:hypothetical protein
MAQNEEEKGTSWTVADLDDLASGVWIECSLSPLSLQLSFAANKH